jgi:hypothetical protein
MNPGIPDPGQLLQSDRDCRYFCETTQGVLGLSARIGSPLLTIMNVDVVIESRLFQPGQGGDGGFTQICYAVHCLGSKVGVRTQEPSHEFTQRPRRFLRQRWRHQSKIVQFVENIDHGLP